MEGSLEGNLAFISSEKFLEDELLTHGVEVRQWRGVDDVVCPAGEARVEAVEEIEDQLG